MITPSRHHPRVRRRRGFSLIELLLAIFILGVGIISVAAVFPAGIIQQRRTQDDVLGPVIAEDAIATIRSKVTQSDFGTFEEFGIFGPDSFATLDGTFPNSWLPPADAYTQVGDWPWLRPSTAAVPADADPGDRSYAGDIDLFSARASRASSLVSEDYPASMQWDQAWRTTEFSLFNGAFPIFGDTHPQSGGGGSDDGAFLFGIPFNRARFDFFGNGEDPLVTITQEERFWPAGTGFGPGVDRPQYAWDCMFRRFQGRVQVAIFVYRVKVGNAAGGYAVAQDTGSNSQSRESNRPPMPARVDLPASVGGSNYRTLTSSGADPTPDEAPSGDDADRNVVVGTGADFSSPNNLITFDPYFEGWQVPGQWMLDPYGRIHRVVQGRRNKRQGPVRLARPVPTQTPATSLVNPANTDGFDDWQDAVDEVRAIWFIPPADRRGITLEPIYASVREL